MEPVFTLQWPEFFIAQRLQQLLPRKDGFSVLVPLSRQEKGYDLAVLYRNGLGDSKTSTVQVKASRTYIAAPAKREATIRFRFYTWFRRFDVSDRADLVILFGLYAPDPGMTKKVSSGWYKDCSLVFTRHEMIDFMSECMTVSGKPDPMFSFGFNDLSRVILTRGDMSRSQKDYSNHILDNRIHEIIE